MDKKIYILQTKVIEYYEPSHTTRAYRFKENAENALKDLVEQEFRPVAEQRNYLITDDNPHCFHAGYSFQFHKGSVRARIIETDVLDYAFATQDEKQESDNDNDTDLRELVSKIEALGWEVSLKLKE
jgi:hypothetical protein